MFASCLPLSLSLVFVCRCIVLLYYSCIFILLFFYCSTTSLLPLFIYSHTHILFIQSFSHLLFILTLSILPLIIRPGPVHVRLSHCHLSLTYLHFTFEFPYLRSSGRFISGTTQRWIIVEFSKQPWVLVREDPRGTTPPSTIPPNWSTIVHLPSESPVDRDSHLFRCESLCRHRYQDDWCSMAVTLIKVTCTLGLYRIPLTMHRFRNWYKISYQEVVPNPPPPPSNFKVLVYFWKF